jgi:hypothetical protein
MERLSGGGGGAASTSGSATRTIASMAINLFVYNLPDDRLTVI